MSKNDTFNGNVGLSHAVDGPPTPPPDSPRALQSAFNGGKMTSTSGTSTPDFVQTTLEVADTAAQIDPKTPELEVHDEEAGRIGYRMLSPTPIAQVAATAAEVAGVAADLDFDEIDDIEVDIGPDFSHELAGEADNGQDEAPLFAYEFACGGFDRTQSFSSSEYSPGTYPMHGPDYGGDGARSIKDIDPKDPSLEKFPSNLEGIYQKVLQLETGLTEDVPSFDGFPVSPVVSAGRKSSADLNSELFSISPSTAATQNACWLPNNSRNGRSSGNGGSSYQQENPRRSVSKGSTISEPSPSLQCIVEENALTEEDDEDAVLSMPTKVVSSGIMVSPRSAAGPPLPPVRHTIRPETAPMIVLHRARDAANLDNRERTE